MPTQEQIVSAASERLGEPSAVTRQALDDRRSEAKALIERSGRAATELASVMGRWREACARGASPSDIRSLNTEIAALTERLKQLDAAALAACQP